MPGCTRDVTRAERTCPLPGGQDTCVPWQEALHKRTNLEDEDSKRVARGGVWQTIGQVGDGRFLQGAEAL